MGCLAGHVNLYDLLLVFPELDKRPLSKGCFFFSFTFGGLIHPYPFETYVKPATLLERRDNTEESHNTGNFTSFSFRIVCGFFHVPQSYEHWRIVRRGLRFYRPYPRRLESLTICRRNYKSNTFSSVILRPWVLVWPGFWILDLPHRSPIFNQLSQRSTVQLLSWYHKSGGRGTDLMGGSFIAINFVPVQQQFNFSDCGVFAMAFARCLTFEVDPSQITFDIHRMRPHLPSFLRNGGLSLFSFF